MKILYLFLCAFYTSQAFSGAAVLYNCVGKNKVNSESVVFEIQFSDSSSEAGYTNQAITVTKSGWENLKKPDVLQMYQATKENNCQLNEAGERYYPGTFDMRPTKEKDLADYIVTFNSDCGKDKNYNITAFCFFAH
jgi:hypothetical protein